MIEFFVSSASYSNVCTNVEISQQKNETATENQAYNEINIVAKKFIF